MSCNGGNHPPNCNCRFRGGHNRGLARNKYQSIQIKFGAIAIDDDEPERKCFVMNCPACHDLVWYIKNEEINGVFFDEPLGAPWSRHLPAGSCSKAIEERQIEYRAKAEKITNPIKKLGVCPTKISEGIFSPPDLELRKGFSNFPFCRVRDFDDFLLLEAPARTRTKRKSARKTGKVILKFLLVRKFSDKRPHASDIQGAIFREDVNKGGTALVCLRTKSGTVELEGYLNLCLPTQGTTMRQALNGRLDSIREMEKIYTQLRMPKQAIYWKDYAARLVPRV